MEIGAGSVDRAALTVFFEEDVDTIGGKIPFGILVIVRIDNKGVMDIVVVGVNPGFRL